MKFALITSVPFYPYLQDAQTPTTTNGDQSVVRSENLRISETNALSDKEAKELTAAEVLHAMSLSIVSLFMIEISVKVIAFGLDFFKSKLEVFDAIVVIISFVLDVLSLVLEEQFAALQLLILLRLWRIVRVINGKET